MVMGLISEACKESMSKNMAEAMKMACMGVLDENVRVRYAGLSCLALLLTELSPKAQKKYHQELMPVLLNMMSTESLIKMQTHTVSTVINFANGLHNQDEEEEDDAAGDNSDIIKIYSDQLFEILVQLLKKAIDTNYEPM
jgi:CII-binding regulator of phage lambda lysogenization HflD